MPYEEPAQTDNEAIAQAQAERDVAAKRKDVGKFAVTRLLPGAAVAASAALAVANLLPGGQKDQVPNRYSDDASAPAALVQPKQAVNPDAGQKIAAMTFAAGPAETPPLTGGMQAENYTGSLAPPAPASAESIAAVASAPVPAQTEGTPLSLEAAASSSQQQGLTGTEAGGAQGPASGTPEGGATILPPLAGQS